MPVIYGQHENALAAKCSDIDDTSNPKKCSDIGVRSNQNALTLVSDQNPKCSDIGVRYSYLQDCPTKDRPTVGMYLCEEGTRGAASQSPPAPLAGAAAGTPVHAQNDHIVQEWTDVGHLTCAKELELARATHPQNDELLEVRWDIVAGVDRLASQAHLKSADRAAGCHCCAGPIATVAVKKKADDVVCCRETLLRDNAALNQTSCPN